MLGWLWLKENNSSPSWCYVAAKCFPCKGKGPGHNHIRCSWCDCTGAQVWTGPSCYFVETASRFLTVQLPFDRRQRHLVLPCCFSLWSWFDVSLIPSDWGITCKNMVLSQVVCSWQIILFFCFPPSTERKPNIPFIYISWHSGREIWHTFPLKESLIYFNLH